MWFLMINRTSVKLQKKALIQPLSLAILQWLMIMMMRQSFEFRSKIKILCQIISYNICCQIISYNICEVLNDKGNANGICCNFHIDTSNNCQNMFLIISAIETLLSMPRWETVFDRCRSDKLNFRLAWIRSLFIVSVWISLWRLRYL